MSIIEWNDEIMSVGVKVIDQEHKHLVDLVNQLHDAMESNQGTTVLKKVLDEIVSYTFYHFHHEEEMFGPTPYPEASAHRQAHEKYAEEVMELHSKYRFGPSNELLQEVFIFAKSLLMEHSLGMDQGYAKYLKDAGYE